MPVADSTMYIFMIILFYLFFVAMTQVIYRESWFSLHWSDFEGIGDIHRIGIIDSIFSCPDHCYGIMYNVSSGRSSMVASPQFPTLGNDEIFWHKSASCMSSPCLHGGTCTDLPVEYSCDCFTGYSGRNCEIVGHHIHSTELRSYMSDMYDEGDWGSYETCPTGSYAAGIQLTIDSSQGSGDDTAVNVIRLLCKYIWGNMDVSGSITSATATFGTERSPFYCPQDYWIVQYNLYYEPDLGSLSDDTAVNGLLVTCRGPHGNTVSIESSLTWVDSRWGEWSAECPPGTAVCAMKTRAEPDQGSSWGVDIDDGSLTDATMVCCHF